MPYPNKIGYWPKFCGTTWIWVASKEKLFPSSIQLHTRNSLESSPPCLEVPLPVNGCFWKMWLLTGHTWGKKVRAKTITAYLSNRTPSNRDFRLSKRNPSLVYRKSVGSTFPINKITNIYIWSTFSHRKSRARWAECLRRFYLKNLHISPLWAMTLIEQNM